MKKTVALALLFSVSAYAAKWDKNNNPANFDKNYNYKFDSLPMKSILPLNKTPWSSSYWPRKKGSINYRWNSPNPTGYDLVNPTFEQVKKMSIAELAQLSPAEKFDLAQGHYNYPLSNRIKRRVSPEAKDYEGICDGWTATAIQFAEPAPIEFTNPDGIVIPLGSSDVKALMSFDVSINFEPGTMKSRFIGGYCKAPWGMRLQTPNCVDVNAGAFHVVLANQIGLKQQSFAVDVDSTKETWNQPVYGYEFEVRGRTEVDGVANAYLIHGKMMYAEDDLEGEDAPRIFNWLPTIGTSEYASEVMEVDYILEVDAAGNITGGTWLGESKTKHPDLFWMPTVQIEFTPAFQILNKLYKPFFIE